MGRPRVVYWNSIPSPNFVDRLNAVADRGAIDLEAWFCARTEPDRSWTVNEAGFRFPYRYLPSPPWADRLAGGRHMNLPGPLFRHRTADLLVSLYAEPTFLAGWSLARARGIRTAFRYLPTFDRWVNRTSHKEWLKRQLFPRVDGFKTSGPEGKARLLTYGVDSSRIHAVTQSIDVPCFLEGSATWRPRRDEVRAGLDLRGCVFVFVGRLWWGKGLDHLLEAYGSLARGSATETTLLVVGDGADEARYRAQAASLGAGHVVFTGFVQQPDLPPLYAASDVFVLPTLGDPNGLVIEEAMVSGLPVIAFDSAGDVRLRVPENVAGHVVPTGDAEALRSRMEGLAADPAVRRRMGEAARGIARLKTHERYAEDFERFVDCVLTSPRIGERTRATTRGRPRSEVPPSTRSVTNMVVRPAARRRKPRVVYWNNIPSPYMVDRFNALADRGRLDFEAWFSTRTEPDRSWAVEEDTWRFRHRYLRGVGLGPTRAELPGGLLRRYRPDLLVSLYASPSFLAGRALAAMGGTKVAFWTEVTFDAWVRRRRWKEAIKRAVFSGIDGVITVGDDGRRFAQSYGAPDERIHLAPHVIDVERFAAGAEVARAERGPLRAQLGLRGCTFMYAGRLWAEGKGLDHLISAFAVAAGRSQEPMTLILVGDGPDEAQLRRHAAGLGLDNVLFAGFQASEVLPRFYAASDVFVFPTLGDPYGLVLDEAMACSLPLISTTAAGELALRLLDGENGFVVPPADVASLARAMEDAASDPERLARMGAKSREMVEGRTPTRWARDFERAVAAILKT